MQWSGPDKTLLEQAHRYAELGNRARLNVKNGVAYLSLPDSPVESRRQLPTTRWTRSKGGTYDGRCRNSPWQTGTNNGLDNGSANLPLAKQRDQRTERGPRTLRSGRGLSHFPAASLRLAGCLPRAGVTLLRQMGATPRLPVASLYEMGAPPRAGVTLFRQMGAAPQRPAASIRQMGATPPQRNPPPFRAGSTPRRAGNTPPPPGPSPRQRKAPFSRSHSPKPPHPSPPSP